MQQSTLASWFADFAAQVSENAAMLTDLDRQIGDADHGSNLDRGMKAVAALDPAASADAKAYLKQAGMTLVSTVGGASGPLYGTLLLRMATALPEGELDAASWAAMLQAGLDGIVTRGHATEGDKTMVDALSPAVRAAKQAADEGTDLAAALEATAKACAEGRDAATPLVARKGRASYLGEKSADHADPGATSLTMMLESAARTLS